MAKSKSTFSRFLKEFDGGGFGSAYTANVLGHTQMTQDPMRDEREKKRDKKRSLEKEINDSLSSHDDSNLKDDDHNFGEDDKRNREERVLSMLKNLLFKAPGYDPELFRHEDETDAKMDDHNVDPEEFSNGEEIDAQPSGDPNGGIDPVNPRKSPDYTVTDHGNDWNEDKHEQLLNAINDLRQELKRKNGEENEESYIEQEEDVDWDEDEAESTQYAGAQKMFTSLVNQKVPRAKIIANFEKQLGVTNSTAVSYYQRLAKQAGLTNSGDREMEGPPPGLGSARPDDAMGIPGGQEQMMAAPEESNIDGTEVPNDPNKQGLIRTVKGAHLVYKRKNEEGTFDELWLFGTGDEMENSLEVRRNILAGTDIPPRSTKSKDGAQSYTLRTLGNGQILSIKGLPN